MSVGGWVRINLDDPGDGSLNCDMNGGLMGNGPNQAGARSMIRHLSRISAMGTNWIRCVLQRLTSAAPGPSSFELARRAAMLLQHLLVAGMYVALSETLHHCIGVASAEATAMSHCSTVHAAVKQMTH
jgi:hypothetical protein